MILKQVDASNFRGFASASISLPPSGQVLVYGANNAGKSALVSVLDVVAGRTVQDMSRLGGDAPASVIATFTLSPSEARLVVALMQPVEASFFDRGGASQVRFHFVDHGGAAALRMVELDVGDGTFGPIAVAQADRGTFDIFAIVSNTPIDRWTPDKVQNRVTNVYDGDLRGIQEVLPLMQLLDFWRAEYFHFPANRRVLSRQLELAPANALDSDGSNLGGLLLWLQLNEPSRWSELVAVMRDLVPGLGLPQTPTDTAGKAQIAVRDGDRQVLNLESLGTGVAQLLMLVTLGIIKNRSSVLVIEEPEMGLHPAAQRGLADLLRKWATERQVIVTSHSTVFLAPHEESRVLLVERTNGVSKVDEVQSDWTQVLRALGSRLVDALVAERVLIVEGPSDLEVLRTWFPRIDRDPRFAVILAGGGNAAHIARQFSEWLNQADRLEQRKVTFIRDHDEIPGEEVERLAKSGVVNVLSVRELENFLLSPSSLAEYLVGEGANPTVAEIDELLRDSADRLRESVVLRTVAREQPVIRLCDDRLRGDLVKREAGAEDLADAVSSRLPDEQALRSRILDRWAEVSADLSKRWESEWRALAPGADVLDSVFRKTLGRRFNKVVDGPALARHVAPPEELKALIDPVLRRSVDGDFELF